ncbi:MAG: PAS domain S-box protein, partial [Halolamina sp.]
AESAIDGIITIDAESEIQFANPAVGEIFGYDPEELVGESLTELMPERHHASHRRALARFLETGDRTIDWSGIELPGLRSDGQEIDLSISFGTFEQGDERRFEGIVRDITEQKRRERELETYETIVETVQDGIYALDSNGEFVVANQTVADLIGYSRDELLGTRASEIRPTELDELFEEIQASLDGGSNVESAEINFEAADGTTRVLDARYAPFPGDRGGRIGVLRDVTEQHEREQQLERYREYTERAFDAIDDLFFVIGLDGTLQRWNQTYREKTGYTDAELGSMSALEFVPETHHEETAAAIEEVFETGHARLEAPLLTNDGETIPYEYAADRVEDPDGEPRLVGVGRDVSERVERERELERQNERLDEFANIVSHDLRNPLSVAEGRIELARDERDSEHLDAAANAIDRSYTLIEDLLTLAREGEEVTETELLDLEEVMEGCWENVPTAEATLRTDISRGVRADRSRLEQLLENLVRNAVEHGRADVTVTVGSLDDGFYVADDGPGIPPDQRDSVFDPGHSTNDDGTGYGLAIVKRIVESHGWTVRVTDSEAGGARFEITDVASD